MNEMLDSVLICELTFTGKTEQLSCLQQNKQMYQNEKDLDVYRKKLDSQEVGCYFVTHLPSLVHRRSAIAF